MTASELKEKVSETEPYFFTRKTMSFFGDTMKNYGVKSSTVDTYSTNCYTVEKVDVWELYRKRPVKHGNQSSAYFAKDTFKQVFARA